LDVQRRDPERSLTKDEMLDDITLHWLTSSATSSAQLYWENNDNNFNAVEHHRKCIKKVGGGNIRMSGMPAACTRRSGAHQDVMQVKLGRVSVEQECSSRGTLW
jgi:hypothetical protein